MSASIDFRKPDMGGSKACFFASILERGNEEADLRGQPGGGAPPTCRNDQDDTFADYSNYGPDVDLIAPGTCIHSTWMNGGYRTISGTSMASPHVAGTAALYAANNPTASPAQVKSALQGAGNLNWIWPSQDPDGIQERLVGAGGF